MDKQPITRARVAERLDKAGTAASLACAVHCAVLPLFVTLLPLFGLGFLADERVEWALVVLSGLMGITSLCLGFKEHRSRRAFAYLGIGLGMLAVGRIVEEQMNSPWGVLIVVLGGVTLATAHLINRKLCNSCSTCHTHTH
jgi:hypothetical protein